MNAVYILNEFSNSLKYIYQKTLEQKVEHQDAHATSLRVMSLIMLYSHYDSRDKFLLFLPPSLWFILFWTTKNWQIFTFFLWLYTQGMWNLPSNGYLSYRNRLKKFSKIPYGFKKMYKNIIYKQITFIHNSLYI